MRDWAERAFEAVLRRAPNPESAGRLERGEVSRARLVRELVESPEFRRLELLDDGLARARAERARRGRPRELHAPAWSDERAIEIPWVLSRYLGERRVLDIGTAFAEPLYVEGLQELGAEELVTVDLAEPAAVVADVRDLPFEDGRFDLIHCVSTIEHVGRDNAVYDVDAPREQEGDAVALRELRRVLARDGRLLVTVPTGERDDQGWQLQRGPLEWIELFERVGFLVFEDELYVHGESGWRTGTLGEARAARYGEHHAGAVLLAELRPATAGERLRLAVRDARHRDVVRRSTRVP